jgi:hypothetical protein
MADATLSPLTAGDYVIELSLAGASGERRILTPIRIER